MPVKSFRELLVWQKGMELVEETYSLVKLLPKEETYALSDQMRRAAVSIPSNIAEGQKRKRINYPLPTIHYPLNKSIEN